MKKTKTKILAPISTKIPKAKYIDKNKLYQYLVFKKASIAERISPSSLKALGNLGFRYYDDLIDFRDNASSTESMAYQQYQEAIKTLEQMFNKRYLLLFINNPENDIFSELVSKYYCEKALNYMFNQYLLSGNLTSFLCFYGFFEDNISLSDLMPLLLQRIISLLNKNEQINYKIIKKNSRPFVDSMLVLLDDHLSLKELWTIRGIELVSKGWRELSFSSTDTGHELLEKFILINLEICMAYSKKNQKHPFAKFVAEAIVHDFDVSLDSDIDTMGYVLYDHAKITDQDFLMLVKHLKDQAYINPLLAGIAFYYTSKIKFIDELEVIIQLDKKTYQKYKRLMLGRIDTIIRDPKFPAYLSRGRVGDIEL